MGRYLLWVPHHAMALVCVMLAALLLWMGSREPEATSRVKVAALAGVSFASAFGLSAYVAAAGALVLGAWFLSRLFCTDRGRATATTMMAACVAGVILSPYLAQMLHHNPGGTSATSVLGFGVRRMFPPEMLAGISSIQTLSHVHPYRAMEVSALLLLIPGYVAELGFFRRRSVGCVLETRTNQRGSRTSVLDLHWVVVGNVHTLPGHCDERLQRASLAPPAVLSVASGIGRLGVRIEAPKAVAWRVCAGWVCGNDYQVAMLRFYLPWHEAHGDSLVAGLSERNYALRDAYATLDSKVPAHARVQYNNIPGGYFLYAQMINANRQVVAGDYGCDTTFGGEPEPCLAIQHAISQLYRENGSSASVTAAEARGLCGSIGAQYLVATRWDKPWSDPAGWVWSLPAVAVNPEVRIVACADAVSVD